MIENAAAAGGALPMGVALGCRMLRDVARDAVIRYADVALPRDRVVDRLRREQDAHFGMQPGA